MTGRGPVFPIVLLRFKGRCKLIVALWIGLRTAASHADPHGTQNSDTISLGASVMVWSSKPDLTTHQAPANQARFTRHARQELPPVARSGPWADSVHSHQASMTAKTAHPVRTCDPSRRQARAACRSGPRPASAGAGWRLRGCRRLGASDSSAVCHRRDVAQNPRSRAMCL